MWLYFDISLLEDEDNLYELEPTVNDLPPCLPNSEDDSLCSYQNSTNEGNLINCFSFVWRFGEDYYTYGEETFSLRNEGLCSVGMEFGSMGNLLCHTC